MSEEGSSGGFAKLLDGFSPVQKVLLFLGFVIFCFGVPGGFVFHDRPMMTGVALLGAGFAGHYWVVGQFEC
jgi:hypothetical protein